MIKITTLNKNATGKIIGRSWPTVRRYVRIGLLEARHGDPCIASIENYLDKGMIKINAGRELLRETVEKKRLKLARKRVASTLRRMSIDQITKIINENKKQAA
jgi:hypothetical protein